MNSENLAFKDFLSGNYNNLEERANTFYKFVQNWRDRNHYFYKRVSLDGSKPVRTVNDIYSGQTRQMIYLASNDYLNLTQHPKVIKAGMEAMAKYGAGAGSVPLLGGTLDLHIELENRVAAFKGTESAVCYTSGFGGNSGTLLSLLGKDDVAVLDLLVHASIIDGCKNTKVRFFKHNDIDHLEKVLKSLQGNYKTIMVAVDGVYSMNGDLAPLDKIYEVCQKYGALIYVDDAHSSGVIGENGRGTAEHFGLEGKIDFVAGTFSKAFGGVGGFIATTKEYAMLLNYFSKSYMFSTAVTPNMAACMIAVMDVIENEPERRARLRRNIDYFKQGIERLGLNLAPTHSAIFPIVLGNDVLVNEATRMLHEQNIYVNPVVYPAVPMRESRIRMSIMSEHTFEQLDTVLDTLESVFKELKIEPVNTVIQQL